MLRTDTGWVYSPSDLVDLLDCDLRSALNHAYAAGLTGAPAPTNTADRLAAEHGQAHEDDVLAAFRTTFGDDIVEIGQPAPTHSALAAAAEQTRRALAGGAPVVYQGVLYDGTFYGRPDFLVRADRNPLTGEHIPGRSGYEPYDSKLARHAAPSAALQLTAYAAALPAAGQPVPEHMHLLLGNGEQVSLAVADFTAVLNHCRDQLATRLAAPATLPAVLWAETRAACGTCRFADHCATHRETSRDLSLVAGIRTDQRRKLVNAGLVTIDALAAADDPDRPADMSEKTFATLRSQAALQVRQDATRISNDPTGTPLWELIDPDALAALPLPDDGDIFFDMEGDPYALGNHGLEYLFGAVTLDRATTGTLDRDAPSPTETFHAFWAHDRAQEKAAFEAFVDFAVARLAQHPDAHIFHYATYEVTALTRLAAQHSTRQAEVDQLLREGRLVDLYKVVRRAVRVSQRSYSIKYLEPLYMPTGRTGEVATASASIEAYEDYLAAVRAGKVETASEVLDSIGEYNEYDCVSTHRLLRWLLGVRDRHGITPATTTIASAEDDLAARRAEQVREEHIAAQVLATLPADETSWDDEQRAAALLAGAVGYYRRELNPAWWAFFRQAESTPEELEDDTTCLVPARVGADDWQAPQGLARKWSRTVVAHTRAHQLNPFAVGDQVRLLYRTGTVNRVTTGRVEQVQPREVRIRETANDDAPMTTQAPVAVLPGPPVVAKPKDGAVASVVEEALPALPRLGRSAVMDLLARRTPRLRSGTALPHPDRNAGDIVAAAIAAVDDLDDSYLAVQGPPGAGKTYLATRLIQHLTGTGRNVGVCSTSHKAIENVLHGVRRAEGPTLAPLRIAKRPTGHRSSARPAPPWEEPRDTRALAKWRPPAYPGGKGYLIGGTAWHFAHNAMAEDPLDVLIIDEAGQFSLVDVIAVSRAARNIVLLGDPQQLPQVVQGTHPTGVDASALGHLLADHDIIPAELGYFLDQTRRMHPDVCDPVSRLAYQGRLHAHTSTASRAIAGVEPGLHPVFVTHHGNVTSSMEEAQTVAAIVNDLLGRELTDGTTTRPLELCDILIVAPFNAQVSRIHGLLGPDARVGTVDRFQGQEAPVSIVSMTTSSADDVSRGLEFLLSRNRLNVALSRAQVAAYLVSSPRLRSAPARSVDQLRLVSGLIGLTAGGTPAQLTEAG